MKYYKLWRQAKRNGLIEKMKSHLLKLSKDLDVEFSEHIDLWSLTKELNQALKTIRRLRKMAPELRRRFLEEAARVALLHQNLTKWKILKNLLHQEQTREEFAKIRRQLGKTPNQSIRHVDIPTEQGWRRETEHEIIQTSLNRETNKHFAQADNTPPVINGVDKVIKEIILENNDSVRDAKLHHLQTLWPLAQYVNFPPPIDSYITAEELVSGFRSWK